MSRRGRLQYDSADGRPATFGCRILRSDAARVVETGRALVESCRLRGTEYDEATVVDFREFHEAIYGARFVPVDLNGSQFAQGPLKLFLDREPGPRMAASSNLATLQMVMHSMARSYRWQSDEGRDVDTFDTAYSSGLLEAWLDRLQTYGENADGDELGEDVGGAGE